MAFRRCFSFRAITPSSVFGRSMCTGSRLGTFDSPSAMHKHIVELTRNLRQEESCRNYIGTITSMEESELVIETDLFSGEVLHFYTQHNLDLTNPETHPEEYQK